jgi:hypothetical protein
LCSANNNSGTQSYVAVDVYGTEFDLALTPVMPAENSVLSGVDGDNWKDKLLNKAGKALFSFAEKMMLRVECRYHIDNLQDGDRLEISLQKYVFGTFDRYDILELIPMMYMFFEVSNFNARYKPAEAVGVNRKEFIKFAKSYVLTYIPSNGIFAFITYPLQVGRIKRLSKNKKILKVLSKFHNMSEAERQKIIEKQEKMF